MCLLATLVSRPEAYAWYRLAKSSAAAEALGELVTDEEIVAVKELRAQVKRRVARKRRVEKSARVCVGSQEMMGDRRCPRFNKLVRRGAVKVASPCA